VFDIVSAMELAVDDRMSASAAPAIPDALRSEALREVLGQLGERVKPIAMARERTVPVMEPLARAFPEGGLVRGRVMSCQGAAAGSIANALVRDALVAGAWLAVVDVDTFGVDAAAELGVPLERVVRIDTRRHRSEQSVAGQSGSDRSVAGQSVSGQVDDDRDELDWIDVMGAAVDGFDVVVAQVPSVLCGDRRPASVRKLSARIQQRGAIVVTLGDAGALNCDVELSTARTVWSGLGDGAGYLRRRSVDVEIGGRRLPGTQTCSLRLDGASDRVEIAEVSPSEFAHLDPEREVVAEMASSIDSMDRVESSARPLAG